MTRNVRPRGIKAHASDDTASAECAYYDELDLSGTVGMFTTRQNSGQTIHLKSETPLSLPRVITKAETPLRPTKLEEHLRKRLEERDKQISILTAENEELTMHCATNQTIIDGLQKELDDLTAQLKSKTRQLVEKSGQLETEQVISADLLEKYTTLQANYEALQVENLSLRQRLEKDGSTELDLPYNNTNARKIQSMQTIAKRLSLDQRSNSHSLHESQNEESNDLSPQFAASEEQADSCIAISQTGQDFTSSGNKLTISTSVSKPSDFLGISEDVPKVQQHPKPDSANIMRTAHKYTTYLDNIDDINDLEFDDQDDDNLDVPLSYADELKPVRDELHGMKGNNADEKDTLSEHVSYSEMYCSRERSRNNSQLGDATGSALNDSLSQNPISQSAELELIVPGDTGNTYVQALHLSASLMKTRGLPQQSGAAEWSDASKVNDTDLPTEIRISKGSYQHPSRDNSISSPGFDSLVLGTMHQATGSTLKKEAIDLEQPSLTHVNTACVDDESINLVTKEAGAGIALEILFDENPKKHVSQSRNQKLLDSQNQRVQNFKERRAQMRQKELEEVVEQSDLAHSRSSSSIIGSPNGGRSHLNLYRRSARTKPKEPAIEPATSTTQPSSAGICALNSVDNTELVYKPAVRQVKSAIAQEQFIEYIPPAKFDNSTFVQKLILHNLLPGTANYERRMLAMDNVSKERGHLLLVLRDTERKSYHSCVKVHEVSGSLVKVDGPDNMPAELAQSIIESMLKYDSSTRSFLVVDQRQLSTLVVAITLRVQRKKVSRK